MKKILKFFTTLSLFVPTFVFAQELTNPLQGANINNIPELINWVIDILFVSVGLLAVLAIMTGGYQMIIGTRGGKEGKIQAGKNTIFWSLMGLITVVFAYTIVRIVLNALVKGDV